MDVVLKNVRFVDYDPETDRTADVRPLTLAEARELFGPMMEWVGHAAAEIEFAEEHTDCKASDVRWNLVFKEG